MLYQTLSSIEADMLRRDVVLYIQMELCEHGTLATMLQPGNSRVVDEAYNLRIILGIIKGLRHIHSLGTCHR
jgi:serine/threonine protein kinase